MGHASITVTLDLYGHLMPGSEDEVGALLDAYLARSLASTRERFPAEDGGAAVQREFAWEEQ